MADLLNRLDSDVEDSMEGFGAKQSGQETIIRCAVIAND